MGFIIPGSRAVTWLAWLTCCPMLLSYFSFGFSTMVTGVPCGGMFATNPS